MWWRVRGLISKKTKERWVGILSKASENLNTVELERKVNDISSSGAVHVKSEIYEEEVVGQQL